MRTQAQAVIIIAEAHALGHVLLLTVVLQRDLKTQLIYGWLMHIFQTGRHKKICAGGFLLKSWKFCFMLNLL